MMDLGVLSEHRSGTAWGVLIKACREGTYGAKYA